MGEPFRYMFANLYRIQVDIFMLLAKKIFKERDLGQSLLDLLQFTFEPGPSKNICHSETVEDRNKI